jgi:hypothetical protein
MKNNKLAGVLCLVLPLMSLVILMAGYAMVSFVMASIADANGSSSVTLAGTIGSVMSLVMGLLGMVIVIALIVGIPLGIYFLAQPAPLVGAFDKRSGKGETSIVPEEIRGWSWGGFMLSWIWGIGNSVWLSLLCFVPFVGFIMIFVLGAKGKEWAWRERQWVSVAEFKRIQKIWDIIGIVIFCLNIAMIIFMIVMMSFASIASVRTYNSLDGDTGNFGDDFGTSMMDTSGFDDNNIPAWITDPSSTVDTLYSDLINVMAPLTGDLIADPLLVFGEARGSWYFEGTFPVELYDAFDTLIASGVATANGDWMTTDFVPFSVLLHFDTVPTSATGTLILRNDNPSGIPANDKSISVDIIFE